MIAARREKQHREQPHKNDDNGYKITQLIPAGALGIAEQRIGEGGGNEVPPDIAKPCICRNAHKGHSQTDNGAAHSQHVEQSNPKIKVLV